MKALILAAAFFSSSLLAANPQVELDTSEGKIVLELAADKAPKSVANFLQYVRDKHFDGTIFHRVIPNFMIQGGGFTPEMQQKPVRAPVENEARNGLKNARGTLAMARTNQPHSGTAQFFINHKDNGFLDSPGQDGWGYAVFGKVSKGMEVVDRIAGVPTGNAGPFSDVPRKPVLIKQATIISTP